MKHDPHSCQVCGAPALRIAYTKGDYSIAFCPACRHGRPVPMPEDEELRAFYSLGHHAHAIDDSCNTAERLRVLKTIRSLSGNAHTLLDVGCGFGHYLDVAKRLGFDAGGYEIDAGRVAICKAKGYQIWSGATLDSVPADTKWDVILLNHVIEHLREPEDVLRHIHARMHKHSILYVSCPNFRSLRARIKGEHYEHICPPEHIQYFSELSLLRALENADFKKLSIRHATHELHVKDLFAFLLKGRWLRRATYVPQGPNAEASVQRFVDGKFPALRRLAYGGLIGLSRKCIPFVNHAGGDHFESYWMLGRE